MAREYTVTMEAVTTTALVNGAIVFINPSATAANATGLEMLRGWCSQQGSTTSAQQGIAWKSQVTAFPTLTSATPAKTKQLDPASLIVGGAAGAAGTCGVNATVIGAGAKTSIYSDNFNVLNGWLWIPTQYETLIFPAMLSSGVGIYQVSAFGTTSNWSAGITFRELG